MILFLDFDGVLHPEHDGEPTPAEVVFCHLPRFEGIMRDFPEVRIVISSTWRTQFSLEVLRARFSPDIAARIIDTTPVGDAGDHHYIPARREQEILAWLSATNRLHEPWLALDDAAWQFKAHRDRLIACSWYVGLNDAVEQMLRARLAAPKVSASEQSNDFLKEEEQEERDLLALAVSRLQDGGAPILKDIDDL